MFRRIWLLYWLGMFVATHIPKGQSIGLPPGQWDKLVHAGMFFGLTVLGGRAIVIRKGTRTILAWALIYAAYAVVDEWLQGWVHRTPSIGDWAADAVGIVLGILWLKRGIGKREELVEETSP
ncbi:MAG: VanZ family protein [Planctomycetota bacterium]